jgi:sulfatase maturation enzyme AslB (radical SAM superfamily)
MTTQTTTPATPQDVAVLEVILTASCNLRCSYCYQNDKQGKRMEWETLQAALDLVLQSAQDEVSVVFYGGEPLLELPLIRRAVAYVDERRPPRLRVQYTLSTNGLLVDEEAAAFLAAHRFETQLSFDGVPAAQAMRGLGTHAKLDRLLDRLRVDHPTFFREDFRVAITLHSGSLHHLADSVDYFIDKQVHRIEMSPLFTHDPGWTDDHLAVLDRQLARVFERSVRHYRDTGRVPVHAFRKTAEPSLHQPAGGAMCGAGSGRTLAVDVDGQVGGCMTFMESYQRLPSDFLRSRLSAMKMGDLRDPAFPRRLAMYPEAAERAGLFGGKHRKYSSYGRCGECRHVSQCAVCPTSIGHIPGNTDPDRVPDNACAWNLVSLGYKERFPTQPDPFAILSGRAPVPRLVRELRALVGAR